jgi:hypothetical protein
MAAPTLARSPMHLIRASIVDVVPPPPVIAIAARRIIALACGPV